MLPLCTSRLLPSLCLHIPKYMWCNTKSGSVSCFLYAPLDFYLLSVCTSLSICDVKQSQAMRLHLHVMLTCEFVWSNLFCYSLNIDVDQDRPAIDIAGAVKAAAAAVAVAHDGDSDTFGWVSRCSCMIIAVQLLKIKCCVCVHIM